MYLQALDDDEISCEIPSAVPEGSTIEIDVFTAAIKHARICADMIKQLLSVKAFKQQPEVLFENMDKLENRLEEWRMSLPNYLTFPVNSNAPGILYRTRANALRLHFIYQGSIIALHANFHYPWICSVLLMRKEVHFRDRISQSSARAAEASRQILSVLRSSTFDMASASL